MQDWQIVYQDDKEYRAEIVKAVLEKHELQPVIINKGISPYDMGKFEVCVSSDEVLHSLKIIKDVIKFD